MPILPFFGEASLLRKIGMDAPSFRATGLMPEQERLKRLVVYSLSNHVIIAANKEE